MRAVRFAATILRPAAPDAPPPGFRQDGERLLQLAAGWREAALELGEFAPERPALRLVSPSGPDGKHPTAHRRRAAGPGQNHARGPARTLVPRA
ncbi:hypothetical protein ACF07T_15830 [Streptomyces sp. NPDC015184]|uniref:hypothetical protein n=1 Tax=Streptomyces sp. NPDC015184 TaxID=3364946 RepID=UPI0036F9BA72